MDEDLLKFNIYAMVMPSNPKEYIALLDEAIAIVQDMNDQLDDILKEMDKE